MEIRLPYGEDTFVLDIPEKNLVGILKPNPVRIREKIDVEDLQQNLNAFLKGTKSILIIVNDYTRPTPTVDIISMIEPQIKDYEFRFIVACGSHRRPSDKELIQIFGKYAEIYNDKILIHDAKDNSRLKFLGKTKLGTPVWLNQALWEADKIIAINSVEPHYFAGYTGGRKSFVPGVAGLETITVNHKLSLRPETKTLALKYNPVHEDMTEVTQMIPRPIFSIQTVIDAEHNLYSIRYSDIIKSFELAVSDANKIFCVPLSTPVDIVIAFIQSPYDVNFYQSQKAIENAKLALKDNGIMIVLSRCRDGVGDDEFVKVFASEKDPRQLLTKINHQFKLGYHKSAKLIETMLRAEIWTVMPIDENVIKSVFMKPFADLKSALMQALAIKGDNAQIIILPDASLTVPFLQ